MKRIGIEALLAWAYRQELPKAGGDLVVRHAGPGASRGGWDPVSEYGETLALIQMSNHWGCVPDFSSEDGPHPDAVLVGQAVSRLAGVSFDAAPGYDVLTDLVLADGSQLTETERDDCHMRGLAIAQINGGRMPATIARLAILGQFPEWRATEAVTRKPVCGANGKEAWFRMVERSAGEGRPLMMVEADGFDRVLRRPYPNAYRKARLTPDPARLVSDRAEYQVFVLALAALAADLDGTLAEHRVDGPSRRLWPWDDRRVAQASGGAFAVNFVDQDDDTHRRERKVA